MIQEKTALKLINKSVKDWSAFQSDVLENSPQPFACADADGRILYCNNAYCELLGYEKEEILNLKWMDFTPPEWCDFVINIMRKKYSKAGQHHRYQKEYLRKDGSRVPVELLVKNAADSNGNIIYNVFVTDISERKKLEEKINKHQEYLERLVRERTIQLESVSELLKNECEQRRLVESGLTWVLNLCPLPILIADLYSGELLNCNQSFCEAVGYQTEEIIGKTVKDLNIWVDLEARKQMIKIIKEFGSFYNYETKFRKRTNEIGVVLISGAIIYLKGRSCLLTISTDITEKKSFEMEMLRLDKLNLIGQMAASIGHEIRNPMTTVRGCLQLLSKDSNNINKKYYDIMIGELDRANSIITEFLSLSKNKIVKLDLVSLNEILDALYPLLFVDAVRQNKSIVLKKEAIPKILADDREIRQLILNLVFNGLEAMNTGGVVYISTYLENNEVVLSITDEGTGIAAEIFDKIGNPFFSTKENGTGLGLAVCYSIADRHNAKIDFKTSSAGTTFYVRFKQESTDE